MKSDIEIAQAAQMQPITQIAEKLGLTEDEISLYGKYKAKIDHRLLQQPHKQGNCLLVMPLAQKAITPAQMLRSWVVVYLGNFIGAMAVAWIASASHTFTLFGDRFAISVVSTAAAKCSLSFTDALLRGILCNLLVCLAVWISFAAKSVGGKIAGLYLPILLFVLCGYEHCVANMYYIPAGIFALADPAYAEALAGLNTASVTWAGLAANLISVTLGNILGGAGLGLVYWYIYLKKPKA